MLRNLSLFGGLLVVTACFPDLSQYEGEGSGGGASSSGTATGTPTSGATTASSNPTTGTSTSTGDGGDGGGGGTGAGDASSTGGAASSTSSSSSTGGGGGVVDACLSPSRNGTVQDGALVEGTNDLGDDYRFCIDHTEVTHIQYRAFYNDVVAGSFALDDSLAAFPYCDWKSAESGALVPTFGDMFESDWDDTTFPDVPMVEIDVCDASAYCDWAGKRLCGGIGGTPIGATEQQLKNEWYLACSNDGARPYCYNGDDAYPDLPISECIAGSPNATDCPAYDADRCATGGVCETGWRSLWTEEMSSTCDSAFPGVVNLSGNVAEWVAACTPDPGQGSGWKCEQRGGSCGGSVEGGFYSACAWVQNPQEGTDAASRGNFYGFRCCWDPEEG